METLVDAEQAARDGMAAGVDRFVVAPLALLSGLIAQVGTADDADVDVGTIGMLLGLVVRGVREELDIHRKGGYEVQAAEQLFEGFGIKTDWKCKNPTLTFSPDGVR